MEWHGTKGFVLDCTMMREGEVCLSFLRDIHRPPVPPSLRPISYHRLNN